ncbi:hypothetical protein Pmani_000586 [Petrolisthes manimaculis]|uniref:Uncharacterized protein n=1 Tax=Petrolisthes manimaculis TaxID=1843537 RepID=A0AAE1USU9_9EUCA|nr:hypothetical protein Pmani_000586 [Petrolisthes manimaculis]
MGHFSKVCRSPSASASVTFSDRATLATITSAAAPGVLSKAVVSILVNGTKIDGFIDSGNSGSFIHPDLVKQLSLDVQQSQSAVTLASTSFSAKATVPIVACSRWMSSGEAGSGSGMGEEQYFRKLQHRQLEKIRCGIEEEVEFHRQHIQAHQDAIKRHHRIMDELEMNIRNVEARDKLQH